MSTRVLIAGIGNIFLGDDAFGSEVARRLAQQPWPQEVQVRDFGIRGLDLAYELTAGCELAILIDAAPRGKPLGTLSWIEPDVAALAAAPLVDAHTLDPVQVLRLAAALGGTLPRVLLCGCEPADLGEGLALSPAVEAAVPAACELVTRLVSEFLRGTPIPAAAAASVR